MKHLCALFLLLLLTAKANAQCTAAFTYTNNGNVYTFTDASTTSSGSIVGWAWTFGDQTAPSTQQNPAHTYVPCGYFVVTLNIFTSSFCSASVSDTIYNNSGTTPSYTYTVDTTNGNVQFQGNPQSTLLNYSWDFGDASTGTGMNTQHTYATSGTYTVCLTTSDTGNVCTNMFCDTINVYIAPPTCNATWNANSIGQGNYAFNATPFNNNWDYSWDFGDNSTGTGFVSNHQYTASGTYTICLTVVDSAANCSSTFCDTMTVTVPTTCPPAFTANGFNGTYVFTASPFSLQNTYLWDYGDGSPMGMGVVSNHTYTTSGTYTVCVIMSTPSGCTGTFCDTVNVVISGIEENGGISPVTFFPNPATSEMQLHYFLAASATITTSVVDVAGRTLLTQSAEKSSGEQNDRLDLSSLAPGTYFLRVQTANGGVNKIFVKE